MTKEERLVDAIARFKVNDEYAGLLRVEYFAIQIYQSLLNGLYDSKERNAGEIPYLADDAVEAAEMLMFSLAKYYKKQDEKPAKKQSKGRTKKK